MEIDCNYIYPDHEVLLTFTPEEVEDILNKGSFDDYYADRIFKAIRYIYNNGRD